MGWEVAAPLLTGLVTSGISAFIGNRQAKKSAAEQAALVSQSNTDSAARATAFAASMANQNTVAASKNVATPSVTTPAKTPTATKLLRLNTISTSPFGDTSKPFLGKRKLLGN